MMILFSPLRWKRCFNYTFCFHDFQIYTKNAAELDPKKKNFFQMLEKISEEIMKMKLNWNEFQKQCGIVLLANFFICQHWIKEMCCFVLFSDNNEVFFSSFLYSAAQFAEIGVVKANEEGRRTKQMFRQVLCLISLFYCKSLAALLAITSREISMAIYLNFL